MEELAEEEEQSMVDVVILNPLRPGPGNSYEVSIDKNKKVADLLKYLSENYPRKPAVSDISLILRGSMLTDPESIIGTLCNEHDDENKLFMHIVIAGEHPSTSNTNRFVAPPEPVMSSQDNEYTLPEEIESIQKEINEIELAIPKYENYFNSRGYRVPLFENDSVEEALKRFEDTQANLRKSIALSQKLNMVIRKYDLSRIASFSSMPGSFDPRSQRRHAVRMEVRVPNVRQRRNNGRRREQVRVQRNNVNNNNIREAGNNNPQPRNRRRNVNLFNFLNITLVFRIALFVYLFFGSDFDVTDYSFLKTLGIALIYYAYEVGFFDYVFGMNLSFTGILNSMTQHRLARVERVTDDYVHNNTRTRRVAHDVFVFFKAFVLSIIPTWQVREYVPEEPGNN